MCDMGNQKGSYMVSVLIPRQLEYADLDSVFSSVEDFKLLS